MPRATQLTALFLGICLSGSVLADGTAAPKQPTASASFTKPQVQQAVDRSIGYLQAESASWLNTRKCAACHHAGMPLWALNEADRRGYVIDKKFVADKIEASLGSHDKLIASRLVPGPKDPPDPRPLWQHLARTLHIVAVPGEHLELVDRQAPAVAAALSAMLRRPDGIVPN